MVVVLVHDSDVEKNIFLIREHSLKAVLYDDCEFIVECWFVGDAVWNGRCQQQSLAILVLQSFSGQCGSPSGCPDQKSPGLDITGRPGQIAHSLEAEHRVEDIERYHCDIMICIGCARGDPGSHGTRLCDSFLQYLTLLVFAVIHQLIGIFRNVELPLRRIDAKLAKHAFHTKCTRLIGYDGHYETIELGFPNQRCQYAHECHRG